MEKLLTIAVPSYNVAWCIDKCLSSFLCESVLDSLEVIIVNDGSTDTTLETVSKYIRGYPSVFRLIDKKNGGHGSAINAAILQASGKYFKVVDADDWVENLPDFIKTLSGTDADAIMTSFHTVDMVTKRRREYRVRDIELNRVYELDEFTKCSGDIYPCAVFHGLTYRTEVYKESGTVLSEGIFYEDQEYATLPFTKVRTVLPLDMFLYEYMIGNTNQSVSDKNQVKRLGHLEHVLMKVFRCYTESVGLSDGARRYIAHKAKDLLFGYYVCALIKNPDKRAGRAEASRVRQSLMALETELVKHSDKKYGLAVLMNRLRFGSRALSLLKRPVAYDVFWKLFKKNEG